MCYSALIKRDLDYLQRNFGASLVREQFDDYERRSKEDPKLFPKLSDRIYPGYYAPVIHGKETGLALDLMRYGAYPPSFVAKSGRYTTYNARRDNLSSRFWSEAFGQHHGFVVLEGFFEWVEVKDLVQAGVVSIEQVKAEFDRQRELRRARIEAQGKIYRPTPTEKKDPRFRKTIIRFQAEDERTLIVPVIFSKGRLGDGTVDHGFAIVTDDPPPEVEAAGHDRCPVVFDQASIEQWLHPEKLRQKDLDRLFDEKSWPSFNHSLAASG